MNIFTGIIHKLYFLIKLSRINTPTGIFLLFLPCCFGYGLTQPEFKAYGNLWVFFLGSVLMRSFGCIINDIIDRDIDKYVDRTKNRPIASGKVTIIDATIFACIILSFSLIVVLQLSYFAIFLSVFALIPVFIYPFMKRITYYPQLFLGITYNSGVLVAYANNTNTLTLASITMYMSCIFWTLGYDTIYAFMDMSDDEKIKVKSLALMLRDKSYKIWILGFYTTFISLFLVTMFLENIKLSMSKLLLIVLAATILIWQVVTLNIASQNNCFYRFKSNVLVGTLLYFALTIY